MERASLHDNSSNLTELENKKIIELIDTQNGIVNNFSKINKHWIVREWSTKSGYF